MISNNLIYQILKLELSKLKRGISINEIDFVKDCDDSSFCVYLEVSGFDLALIKKQMEELVDINKTWKKTNKGKTFTGFIDNSRILEDEKKIAFTILKTDFLNFLNKEKLNFNN